MNGRRPNEGATQGRKLVKAGLRAYQGIGMIELFQRMQRTLTQVALLALAIAGGCGQRQTIVIHVDASRGTNVTMVTTNGYTIMLGPVVFGTNATTNASAPDPSR